MPSKNGISVYLTKEDKILFEKAVKAHNIKKSKLLKEIIHAWLFSNKIQIEAKYKK